MSRLVGVGLAWVVVAGCGHVASEDPGVASAGASAAASAGASAIASAGASATASAGASAIASAGTGAVAAGAGGTPGAAGAEPSNGGALSTAAGQAGTSNGAGDGGGAGASPVPHPYQALQIATGRYHSCALLENHRVKCWGDNSYGQLGLGSTLWRGLDQSLMGDGLPFVDLGTGRTAKSIAAGRYTTCAILDDDSVKCWGLQLMQEGVPSLIGDAPGELGDNLPPIALGAGRRAKAVAVGYYVACIALDDDSFLCGDSGTAPNHVPAAPDAHLVSMASNSAPIGLFDDRSARGLSSELVAGPSYKVASNVLAIAGSQTHTCFLLQGQQLQCSNSPGLPPALPGAVALAISERGALCAIVGDGRVRCWGATHQAPSWPAASDGSVDVPLTAPAVQISSAAFEHHCALLSDGAVECWSWAGSPTDAVGFDDHASPVLKPVNLGTWQP